MTTRWMRRALPVAALALAACGGEDAEVAEADGRRCMAAVGTGIGNGGAERIAWRTPSGKEARAALARWCAAVGPAVLAAPAEGAGPESASGGPVAAGPDVHAGGEGQPSGAARADLAVVAWNVQMGAGDILRFVRDLRAGALTGGGPVEEFVLLVQEAHRTGELVPAAASLPAGARDGGWDPTGGPPDIVAVAESLGLHLLYAPSMRNGARADRANTDHGNAILSTLPLERPAVIDLGVGLQRRVVVAADLPAVFGARQPLRVYSVHLDNADWRNPLASLGSVRSRQAGMIAAVLPDSGAVLVGGDLNTWLRESDEATYRVLRRRLPLPERQPTAATATRLGLGRRLDWLLLRAPAGRSLEARVVPDRYGSDHNPVLGLLRPSPELAHVLLPVP